MTQLPPPSEADAVRDQEVPDRERRRPGRPAQVSPALLPLLRRDSLLAVQSRAPGGDDLAPARGVAASVLIGALIWIGAAVAVYWLLLR